MFAKLWYNSGKRSTEKRYIMDIASIDSFLAINDKYNENTRFFSAKEAPFSIHGVYFDEKEIVLRLLRQKQNG